MKFVIAAVVMFAVAFSAEASIWPLGLSSLITPHGIATIGGQTIISGPAIIPSAHAPAISLSQGPAIVTAAHSPAIAIHAPAAVDLHAAHLGGSVAHQAGLVPGSTYVAKTRGAVHTAPLAGHLNSAASINLQPAPGTI